MPLLIRALFFTAILVIANGCGLFTPDDEHVCVTCRDNFEIHLQSNFDDDHVRVEIDRVLVFEGHVKTNHILGLAELIELQWPEGMHSIKVTVNGLENAAKTFDLNRPLFVLVGYYTDHIPAAEISAGVHIEISKQRPTYY